ncbi:MAG: ABC transporter substrate-binding protein [Anaerolineales bacterium]
MSAACTPVSGEPATELPQAEVTLLTSPSATASAPATVQHTFTPSPTPNNAPDLSGETIALVHLCDRSGPFSSALASRVQAVADTVAALNASGGIFGAELEIRLADTTGSANGAQRALARSIRQLGEGPLVLICDAGIEAAVRGLLNEDEIPALGPGAFAEPRGFLFGLDATPQTQFAFFLQELEARWSQLRPEGAPEEIRVAIFAWPLELAGALHGDAQLEESEDSMLDIVMQAELAADLQANIFDLIYQARDANANVIYTNARGFGLAALLNALNDLGLRQRFVLGAPAQAFDMQVYEYLHHANTAQGVLLTSPSAWWTEEEIPGIAELLVLQPEPEWHDWGYLQMAGAVSLARRALEDAILAEGFEALSSATVLEALAGIEDYPAADGIFAVDFTRGQRSLSELRLWQVGAGEWQLRVP